MNVNHTILKVSFISLLLLTSCSKMRWCWGEDKNEGLIVESYSMKDFPVCVERYVQENGTLIVYSEEELQMIIDSTCTNMPQAGYSETPPPIDFEEYSLLGQWATGQCETKFLREVEKDEENKKITLFSVLIKARIVLQWISFCRLKRQSFQFLILPGYPIFSCNTFPSPYS